MRYIKSLLLTSLALINFIQAEITYKVIDLHPPGAVMSYATGINDAGQVVGAYKKERGGETIIFLWDKKSGFQDIGEGLSKPKINNLGHVISTKNNPTYWNLLLRFDLNTKIEEPYLWTAEKGLQLLGRPSSVKGVESLHTQSINDHDQILVTASRGLHSDNKTWIWQNGNYQQYKNLMVARHLSNQQIIAGSSMRIPMLFNIQNNDFTTYPLQGDIGSTLMSNAKGDAIGFMRNIEGDKRSFFLSQTSGLKILPDNFEAVWMNDAGQILGKVKTDYGIREAFIYDRETLTNASKVAGIGTKDSPLINIDDLYEMNNHGQIVGSALLPSQDKYKNMHAILIEPVTETQAE